jgi:hypothetical protein
MLGEYHKYFWASLRHLGLIPSRYQGITLSDALTENWAIDSQLCENCM